MPSKISRGAVIAAIFIVGAAMAPSANAAPPEDACSLLTQAQVSAALGVSAGAGSHTPLKSLRTCTWTEPNGPLGGKSVVLMLKTANDFNNAKTSMKGPGTTVTPVTGIGDDAYYVAIGASVILYARKGDVAFNLTVSRAFPPDQRKAMEKTLALQILSKL